MIFLEFKTPGKGLPGLILQENSPPYQCLVEMGEVRPTIVLSIGDRGKLRPAVKPSLAAHPCINLQRVQNNLVLIDGDLEFPLHNLQTARGGPQSGYYTNYFLPSTHKLREVTERVYTEVIASVANVVLLDVDNVGGMPGICRFLSSWIIRTASRAFSELPSQVVLLFSSKAPAREIVESHVKARTLSDLKTSDPTTCPSSKDISRLLVRALRIHIATAAEDGWLEVFHTAIAHSISDQEESCLRFSASHIRSILRDGIRRCCQDTSPFELCQATRLGRPVPLSLEGLTEFWKSTNMKGLDRGMLIASALSMDAYPQMSHFFSPDYIFDRLYKNQLAALELNVHCQRLVQDVRDKFIWLTYWRQNNCAIRAHIDMLESTKILDNIRIDRNCCLCFFRLPDKILQCGHRMCRGCVELYGGGRSGWCYLIGICPACGRENKTHFTLKPRTANQRTLLLKSPFAEDILKFLENLQRRLGPAVALSQCFDSIIASDMGIYFAITLASYWRLNECKYHLRKLRPPRTSKNGLMLGKDLYWTYSEVELSSGTPILIQDIERSVYKYHKFQVTQGILTDLTSGLNVKYIGGLYNDEQLNKATNKIISSLFFIEVVKVPDYFTSSKLCQIVVRCRLSPKDNQVDFLLKLKREKFRLHFRGDEREYRICDIFSNETLERVKRSEDFGLQIQVKALSLKTMIDFRLYNSEGFVGCLGNCPYILDKLIEDQGLQE